MPDTLPALRPRPLGNDDEFDCAIAESYMRMGPPWFGPVEVAGRTVLGFRVGAKPGDVWHFEATPERMGRLAMLVGAFGEETH